jgi:hypothetical protein
MKLKLAALLSLMILGLAGCSADYKSNANSNTPAANTSTASAPATPQNNPNIVEASANPTDKTGGTKEGCKCSAAGMACNTKEGEKGCCGGKDGSCSAKREGIADCCSGDKNGGACCSTAGKVSAMTDHKDMSKDKVPAKAEAAEAPAKKS